MMPPASDKGPRMIRSTGFRFFVVGLLALLMFIPLFFAGEIVGARADYSDDTIREVGREWGGVQSLSGPQLVIPVEGPVTRTERREVRNAETGEIEVETYEVTETGPKPPVHIFPDRFDAEIATTSEIRHRGIFNVPVYTAEAEIAVTFRLPDPAEVLDAGDRLLWDETEFHLSLTSNRALRGVAELLVDGRPAALEPRAEAREVGGIFAVVGDPRGVAGYGLSLGFNGAQSLFVAPVGRDSHVTLSSDWPHPSFSGAFLPDSSEISETGFTAVWTIPHLARALPQVARQDFDAAARSEAFGVRFFEPNDFYQKAYRAARYGILFIALTFLTVLLIETRTGKPAHPVQYILIGLAQSTFVLLMVAYAEQIGFGPAYLLAAGATIALLVMFGALALRLGRRTWVLAAMLILLYAVLYLILQSADFALLAGSTLAFAAIAFTMYATRNEDWWGPPRERGAGLIGGLLGGRPPPPPPPAAPGG
jgi:inner membrane protein